MKFQETESVELKRVLNDSFEKEVVAFLNTCDGVIYIGVDENGTIIGVSDIEKLMKTIFDTITDKILPNAQELITPVAKYIDGKMIIEVDVKKGNALYYINKYGRSSKGCFIRIGTSTRGMSEEQINKIFLDTFESNKEMIQIESNQTQFSFNQLKIYYASKGFHLIDETFEYNLKLKTKNNKYNYLAELLSDFNGVSIKIARFQGKDKSVLIEKSEYGHQCLLVAIDRMINRLESENYTMSIIKSARRIDKRLIDMSSLREIFINAIVQNDWSIVEPAVYIFSDRIEIISHGGLPNGQTKEMFFKGVSTPRNKELMRILSDLNYVEQTGQKIPDVVKLYGKEIFEINKEYINVVLPFDKDVLASKNNQNDATINETIKQNGTINATKNETIKQNETKNATINATINLDEVDKDILDVIKKFPKITLDEIAIKLGKHRSTILRHLFFLKENNIIIRRGSRKKGYWEVIDENIYN